MTILTPEDLKQKGQYLYDDGLYDEALEAYKRALNRTPEDADLFVKIGLCYRHKKEYDTAIEYYNKALELEPDNKYALNNIGYSLECKNDKEGAIEMYKKSLEIDPSYDTPLVNLTNYYNDKEMYTEAIEVYKKALKKDHLNTANWIDLGRAYRHIEEYEKAEKAYLKALKIVPKSKLAWNNIGWVYFCLGNDDKAVNAYTKSLEVDWLYDLPYTNLKKIYDKLVTEKSEEFLMWVNVANGFYIAREYNIAIDSINRALKINPDFEESSRLFNKILKAKTKFDLRPELIRNIKQTLDMFSKISIIVLISDVVDFIKYKDSALASNYKDNEIRFNIFEVIHKERVNAKIEGGNISFFERGRDRGPSLTI